MKIFLDTAEIQQIKHFNELGFVDGVTTNPSIIAKSGRKFEDVISEICNIIEGPVSAEVISEKSDDMLIEAKKLLKIANNVCIKLPTTFDGIKSCHKLSQEGVQVNMTLCFSPQQALLVAKAGASFVSPFVGRLDDIGHDGLSLIAEIREIFDNFGYETEILAASIRNSYHFTQCAKIGADVVTLPPSVFQTLLNHPLTEKGLETFTNDWKKSQ